MRSKWDTNTYWVLRDNEWQHIPTPPEPDFYGYYIFLTQYNHLFLNYIRQGSPRVNTIFGKEDVQDFQDIMGKLLVDFLEP